MVRTVGGQTDSARYHVLLGSLPSWLGNLTDNHNWKPIRDEIRMLVTNYKLTGISEGDFKVSLCDDGHGHLYAICEFKAHCESKQERDARDIFGLVPHMFRGWKLQAWLCERGQSGANCVDGPRNRVTGKVLLPQELNPPAPSNPSTSRSQATKGSYIICSNQTGPPIRKPVMGRHGREPNVPRDRTFPAAGIRTQDAFQQPHLEYISPSVNDASEKISDSSRTLRNTPDFPSSSRTSSISAIPDGYLPARSSSSSYSNFHFVPSSPYTNRHSSFSSTSSLYTPSHSRDQSGSSYTCQDTACDEACKIIIQHVKPGVTHDRLSKLLDQEMPPHGYVQHGTPKQRRDNKWSVQFFKGEHAEMARERLHNLDFMGWKLQVHVSGRHINSAGSATSATSSSVTPGPTIVD